MARGGIHAVWRFAASARLSETSGAVRNEVHLHGMFHLVVLETTSERVTLAAALIDPSYTSDGKRVPRLEEFIGSTPAILTVTGEGRLLALAFPRAVQSEDRDVLRLAFGW